VKLTILRLAAAIFLSVPLMLGIWLMMGADAMAQTRKATPSGNAAEKVIIDTDIGDDIDDAFAIALAVRSPELELLGVTTAFGDTQARARIADRLLAEAGRVDVTVLAGIPTKPNHVMTQRRYGQNGRFAAASYASAVDFILEQIRKYPGQITLVGIGPLMNVGALIDKDAAAFRRLKRVVIMGGSIECGYGELWFCPERGPDAEWNIINDIASARKLFESGVPLYVMPLDSTQLRLDETKRSYLFRQGTPLTDALTVLYHQWGQPTPTLFDPVTIAFILNPEICPVQPMHVLVDDKGFTRKEAGNPNAQVCMKSDEGSFFRLLIGRIAPK
jgi:inosine-uridine nucleoside N-ribohydrolase